MHRHWPASVDFAQTPFAHNLAAGKQCFLVARKWNLAQLWLDLEEFGEKGRELLVTLFVRKSFDFAVAVRLREVLV